jgi:hypothetical protein
MVAGADAGTAASNGRKRKLGAAAADAAPLPKPGDTALAPAAGAGSNVRAAAATGRSQPQQKRQLYASYAPGTAPSDEALRIHADDLSSDDEAPRNTVGNVPQQWYTQSGYDHIGYDVSGNKIIKKQGKDGIDRFLASQDDPLYK